jgi:NAD(P)-dependent dehydrogenase (short-subunit alcohol dehydrogenase family)
VRDEDSFVAFLAGVHDRLGPLDILINNAGVARHRQLPRHQSAAEHALQSR